MSICPPATSTLRPIERREPATWADSNDGRIATEKSGHIFLIVIDRPKKLNGFNVKMLSELAQAFSAMEDDSDIRCGVLCADGRNFTAGLELNQVAKHLAEGAVPRRQC